MLLILGSLFLTVVFLIGGIIVSNKYSYDCGTALEALAGVFGLVLMAMIFVLIINHASAIGDREEMWVEYRSLYHQASTGMYNNDNEVGKKELADDIQKWNSTLASKKASSQSLWLNWFYGVDYSQYDFIPIELLD